jgi:putative glutamine amidotransferase
MAWPVQSPLDGLSEGNDLKPRIGLPFCSTKEERTGDFEAHARYARAIELAGGEPAPISLQLPETDLRGLAEGLYGFVLPGSGADVNPELFHVKRHAKSAEADEARERTDFALLRHAIDTRKPVLAICYGIQSLNVFLGGSLVQDIRDEIGSQITHEWKGRKSGVSEPFHAVHIESESRMARQAGCGEIQVNSSHHQSVLEPGRGLRVVARASDGVIEALEYLERGSWITGVQWHPERLVNDPVAIGLFRGMVVAARAAFAGH